LVTVSDAANAWKASSMQSDGAMINFAVGDIAPPWGTSYLAYCKSQATDQARSDLLSVI
jgi:hypothetical protein